MLVLRLARRRDGSRAERTDAARRDSEGVIREDVDWLGGIEGLVKGANFKETESCRIFLGKVSLVLVFGFWVWRVGGCVGF